MEEKKDAFTQRLQAMLSRHKAQELDEAHASQDLAVALKARASESSKPWVLAAVSIVERFGEQGDIQHAKLTEQFDALVPTSPGPPAGRKRKWVTGLRKLMRFLVRVHRQHEHAVFAEFVTAFATPRYKTARRLVGHIVSLYHEGNIKLALPAVRKWQRERLELLDELCRTTGLKNALDQETQVTSTALKAKAAEIDRLIAAIKKAQRPPACKQRAAAPPSQPSSKARDADTEMAKDGKDQKKCAGKHFADDEDDKDSEDDEDDSEYEPTETESDGDEDAAPRAPKDGGEFKRLKGRLDEVMRSVHGGYLKWLKYGTVGVGRRNRKPQVIYRLVFEPFIKGKTHVTDGADARVRLATMLADRSSVAAKRSRDGDDASAPAPKRHRGDVDGKDSDSASRAESKDDKAPEAKRVGAAQRDDRALEAELARAHQEREAVQRRAAELEAQLAETKRLLELELATKVAPPRSQPEQAPVRPEQQQPPESRPSGGAFRVQVSSALGVGPRVGVKLDATLSLATLKRVVGPKFGLDPESMTLQCRRETASSDGRNKVVLFPVHSASQLVEGDQIIVGNI